MDIAGGRDLPELGRPPALDSDGGWEWRDTRGSDSAEPGGCPEPSISQGPRGISAQRWGQVYQGTSPRAAPSELISAHPCVDRAGEGQGQGRDGPERSRGLAAGEVQGLWDFQILYKKPSKPHGHDWKRHLHQHPSSLRWLWETGPRPWGCGIEQK